MIDTIMKNFFKLTEAKQVLNKNSADDNLKDMHKDAFMNGWKEAKI